jgi:hypothetical protein
MQPGARGTPLTSKKSGRSSARTVLSAGSDMGKITHLGQLVIEDAGSVPTLSGAPENP